MTMPSVTFAGETGQGALNIYIAKGSSSSKHIANSVLSGKLLGVFASVKLTVVHVRDGCVVFMELVGLDEVKSGVHWSELGERCA